MTKYRCPLCGREFQAQEATACQGCGFAGHCALISCPQCGYEFPPMPETD